MRYNYTILNSSLAWLLAMAFCCYQAVADQQKLKVGFIAPLSGPAAAYGIASQNGFNMALSELGNKNVEVIYEDDQYSAAKTVTAFKKLTNVDKVDVVISVASTPSNAIAPLAEAAKIPLISWANDPKISKGRSYVVISEQSATVEGKLISDQAIKRGYRSVAYLSSVGDYQTAVAEGVSAGLKDRLVYHEEIASDEKDFRTVILKVKSKTPAAIGICFHPGQFGIFAKQLRDAKITVPLFGCNAMQDSSELEGSGDALAGAWFISASVDSAFEKKYIKQFGNNSAVSGAAVHYEIAKLLTELSDKYFSGINLIAALIESGNRNGAVGSFEVKSDANIQYFNIAMVVKTVGAPRVVE